MCNTESLRELGLAIIAKDGTAVFLSLLVCSPAMSALSPSLLPVGQREATITRFVENNIRLSP